MLVSGRLRPRKTTEKRKMARGRRFPVDFLLPTGDCPRGTGGAGRPNLDAEAQTIHTSGRLPVGLGDGICNGAWPAGDVVTRDEDPPMPLRRPFNAPAIPRRRPRHIVRDRAISARNTPSNQSLFSTIKRPPCARRPPIHFLATFHATPTPQTSYTIFTDSPNVRAVQSRSHFRPFSTPQSNVGFC